MIGNRSRSAGRESIPASKRYRREHNRHGSHAHTDFFDSETRRLSSQRTGGSPLKSGDRTKHFISEQNGRIKRRAKKHTAATEKHLNNEKKLREVRKDRKKERWMPRSHEDMLSDNDIAEKIMDMSPEEIAMSFEEITGFLEKHPGQSLRVAKALIEEKEGVMLLMHLRNMFKNEEIPYTELANSFFTFGEGNTLANYVHIIGAKRVFSPAVAKKFIKIGRADVVREYPNLFDCKKEKLTRLLNGVPHTEEHTPRRREEEQGRKKKHDKYADRWNFGGHSRLR